MTLAELFPKGYLVAQAWRKWFGTNIPPFHSYEDFSAWGDNWVLLVQHEWPKLQQAYGPFETAVLGFYDDPRKRSVPSRNLWNYADNQVLRQIMTDREGIAKALHHSGPIAGLFVLTGWLQKGDLAEFEKWLAETSRKPASPSSPQAHQLVEALAKDPLFRAAGFAEALLAFSDTGPAKARETAKTPTPKVTRGKGYGPTEDTLSLIEDIKTVRAEHPEWGYQTVADSLGKTREAIRYAWRQTGEKWR